MFPNLNDREEIWRGLLYGQRSMMLRLTAELKRDFGLSSAQFEALLTLLETPRNALPATVLSNKLLYSSGSGSHLIARLEELGHVSRTPSVDDARVVIVTLTGSGEKLISAATEAHLAALAREFDPLVKDENVSALLDFARRLAGYESVTSRPK